MTRRHLAFLNLGTGIFCGLCGLLIMNIDPLSAAFNFVMAALNIGLAVYVLSD